MQLAYPLLEASGNGSIVMNSSVAGGPAAINTGSLYAMSKGATQPSSLLKHSAWLCCYSVASVVKHM
jgi:NADP-dependent 3-hydroxy acid dehydrogenase YdfG